MAIISKLRSIVGPILVRGRLINQNSKRFSHGRNLVVETSTYSIRKSWDLIHFYVSIGLLTSLPVIIYVNLTQGKT